MDEVKAIYKLPDFSYIPPTRVCSICDKMENPKATTETGMAWICPECAGRIKKLIYPEVDNG